MKILEDAGWSRLQDTPFVYAKAVQPGSLIEQCHPWVSERSQGYLLIEVKGSNTKVLNLEPDLQKLLVITKLMGLL